MLCVCGFVICLCVVIVSISLLCICVFANTCDLVVLCLVTCFKFGFVIARLHGDFDLTLFVWVYLLLLIKLIVCDWIFGICLWWVLWCFTVWVASFD